MAGSLLNTGRLMAAGMLMAAALAACHRPPDPESLRQAWTLVTARDFDGAMPLAKAYLAWHPESAAAHYVLGKCHLHRPDVNTTLAKGEFETALHCFEKNGDLGPLAPELTAPLFQSALHRDIALALMRALYDGEGQGLPPSLMLPVLDRALNHVREGLRFDPSSGYLREMEQSLSELRQGRLPPPQAPRQNMAPGEITI